MNKNSKKALTKDEKQKIKDARPTTTLEEFLANMTEEERASWLEDNWY